MRIANVVWLVLAACGGRNDLGEECAPPGSVDDCEQGLVCTAGEHGDVCRQICTDQAQCPAGLSCNGVPEVGTIKSCQPQ
jgi:hypothetical protein